jgi:hypothetical protein
MKLLSRRSFLSTVGATALLPSVGASAATPPAACITGPLPRFSPNRLTVACGSRQNFALFLKNSKYMGLSGIVSMTKVTGRHGTHEAGSLFLVPWLKREAKASGQRWFASRPAAVGAGIQMNPIPSDAVPIDEYLARVVMELPANALIGFSVDALLAKSSARWQWVTNVDNLAGKTSFSINWTSAMLNPPWFGGSRWIPGDDSCDGKAWRALILDGLKQATIAAC